MDICDSFLWLFLGGELMTAMWSLVNPWRNCQAVSKGVCFLLSSVLYRGYDFSTSSATFVLAILNYFYNYCSAYYVLSSHFAFPWLLMVLSIPVFLSICIFYFEKKPIQILWLFESSCLIIVAFLGAFPWCKYKPRPDSPCTYFLPFFALSGWFSLKQTDRQKHPVFYVDKV